MCADTSTFKIVSLVPRSVRIFLFFACHLLSCSWLAVSNVYKLTKLVKGTQEYWHRDKMSAD